VWSDIPIGRINIFSDGAEGADNIQVWQEGPPGGGFLIFKDPGEFFAAIEAQGKVSDGFWDFKPNNVGPGFIGSLSDPLNYLNAADGGIWDSMPLDNIQFQSNLNPQGEGGPNPRGPGGLAFATAPFFGIKNNILVANTFVDSFDILSGVPEDANHTAMAFNVVILAGGDMPIHVTVWDKNEENSVKLILPPMRESDDKAFVGILATNDMTIGRVNIYDTVGGGAGVEGISSIEVFVSGDCPWDLDGDGSVGATDLLSLLVTWGVCAPCIDCPADFDGNCSVGATDLLALLVNWGPCP